MRTAKRIFCTLITAVLLLMLSTFVFATESGNAWLAISASEDGNTVVSIMVDETVTDAYVELAYDTNALTYGGVEVNAECVAYYSVNTETAGMVKIAWVSDGTYEAANGVALITFTFHGVSETDPILSGKLNNAAGETLDIRILADMQALEAAIVAGEAVDTTPYTAASVAVLEDALTDAKVLLEDPFAPQEQVDAAADAVYAAMDALTEIPVEKGGLEAAIQEAASYKAENYTADSFAALTAALESAQAIYDDIKATQEQVDAAEAAVRAAMNALEVPVNFSALESAIDAAGAYKAEDYTQESFTAMQSALTAAKNVLANADATQAQVDGALASLEAAVAGLVQPTPETPDSGSSKIWIMILSGAAVVVVVAAFVVIRKKGRCAK